MKFSDQIRYNGMSQQVIHKGGESAINYIKIFQNDKALHTFIENFHQGGK